MAVVYRATVTPTKLELLEAWLPSRSWYHPGGALERVSAFRFDDPAGAVGIETMLVSTSGGPEGGTVYQVPLTYRDAPLDGAGEWLVGTTEHSVLGTRWVYDACGDPVYATALAAAILTGGREAEEYVDTDGVLERRDPLMTAVGNGSPNPDVPTPTEVRGVVDGDPTVIVTDSVELSLVRRPGTATLPGPTLTGTWDGRSATLAGVSGAVL